MADTVALQVEILRSNLRLRKKIQPRLCKLWEEWHRIVFALKLAEALYAQQVGVFITDESGLGYPTKGCKVGDFVCTTFATSDSLDRIATVDANGPLYKFVGKRMHVQGFEDAKLTTEKPAR